MVSVVAIGKAESCASHLRPFDAPRFRNATFFCGLGGPEGQPSWLRCESAKKLRRKDQGSRAWELYARGVPNRRSGALAPKKRAQSSRRSRSTPNPRNADLRDV